MDLDFLGVIMLLAGCFVSYNTGANDAANCIGASVGAGIISFKRAVFLMAIFVFLGAILQGQYVMKTTGEGIVVTTAMTQEGEAPPTREEFDPSFFPDGRLPDLGILVALLSAGLAVTIATYMSIPLSTSQGIVGSVAGVGVGIVGFQGQYFQLGVLYRIFGSWVISPFLTLIVSFLLLQLLMLISRRVRNLYLWEKILGFLVIASSCYFSYNLGSNAFGSGLGPLLNRFPNKEIVLAAIGGVALGVGAITFGRRVTETVGKDITQLDYAGAFAAQLAAGIGLQVFSRVGIPVSSSQAIVGAVFGVGLVKGVRTVNTKKIKKIVIGWILTPTFAAALAAVLYIVIANIVY